MKFDSVKPLNSSGTACLV